MKRAAIYVRVSTTDQHPETQLLDLRQLARQRGLEVVAEYSDKISGTRPKRPGLDELMAQARRGCFDVVLVWAFDRVARSVKHFLEVLDELNHLNIEFVSFRENVDTGGATAVPAGPGRRRRTTGGRPAGPPQAHPPGGRQHQPAVLDGGHLRVPRPSCNAPQRVAQVLCLQHAKSPLTGDFAVPQRGLWTAT